MRSALREEGKRLETWSEWACRCLTDASGRYRAYIRGLERRAADGSLYADWRLRQIAYWLDAWELTQEMLQTAREQGNLE